MRNDIDEIKKEVYELAEKLNSDLGYKYKVISNKIRENIDVNNELHFNYFAKKAPGHWYKILDGGQGNYNLEFWLELRKILQKIYDIEKDKIDSRGINSGILEKEIKNRINYSKTKVRYGVFPCQDTILPMFFKHSYNRNLNVEFIIFNKWGEGLNAFLSNSVDVALHNFSTFLALNSRFNTEDSLYFWPFFSFNGYGIFIKKNTINLMSKKYNLDSNYQKFPNNIKKEIFETCSIILEKNTDFEWVIKKYCEKIGCDYTSISNKINNQETNKGKEIFISSRNNVIYCTNSIHICDLQKNNNYVLIGHGEGLVDHQNFNGLIFKTEYLKHNKNVIAELIATWFNDINDLIKDIRKAKQGNLDYNTNVLLPQLTKFLNEYTDSEITNSDLLNLFEDYNKFYENHQFCFDLFYNDIAKDLNITKNYLEIADIQLQNEQTYENNLTNIYNDSINSIKNNK